MLHSVPRILSSPVTVLSLEITDGRSTRVVGRYTGTRDLAVDSLPCCHWDWGASAHEIIRLYTFQECCHVPRIIPSYVRTIIKVIVNKPKRREL